MKYFLFIVFFLLAVPVMSAAAFWSRKVKGLLFSLLIFSLCLGDRANINFVSLEAYRGPDRGFEVTLADLVALSLNIAMVLRHPRTIKVWLYNTGCMFAYFFVAALTLVWAPQPLLSMFTLFKLLRAYAFYWCVTNCLRTGCTLRDLGRGLIVMAVYLTLETLVQKYVHKIYRVPGPFDQPNAFANFLNLFMPLLLALGLDDRKVTPLRALAFIMGAVAMLLFCVMTFSRAAMLLAAISALGVLGFANLRLRSTRVAVATLIAAWAITVGGALTARRLI